MAKQLFSIHCIKRSQFHAISDFVYKTMKSSNALLSYNLKNIVYQCISRGDTYKICNYARWNHHKSFDFRTLSSANFLGSWHIFGLKPKSYYEIWTFWSIFSLCFFSNKVLSLFGSLVKNLVFLKSSLT